MPDMVFNIAKSGILDGTINLQTDVFKIFPITSAALSDATSEDIDTVGSLTFTEHAGAGFTWGFAGDGRKTLTLSFSTDDTDDEGVVDDTSDYTWSSLGADSAATGFLIYKHLTNDAASTPICWLDGVFTSNGGDVTVQFNAEGILNLT